MGAKLEDFLREIGADDLVAPLASAQLTEAVFDRGTQTVRVHIAIPELLEPKVRRRLREATAASQHKVWAELQYTGEMTLEKLRPALREIRELIQPTGLAGEVTADKLSLKGNRLIVNCYAQFEIDELRSYERKLIELASDMGLSLEIGYVIDQSLSYANANKMAHMQEKARLAAQRAKDLADRGIDVPNPKARGCTPIADLMQGTKAKVAGTIFKAERIKTRTGMQICKLWVYDGLDSLIVKGFIGAGGRLDQASQKALERAKAGSEAVMEINVEVDQFERNDITGVITKIAVTGASKSPFPEVDEPRVEFCAHTKMSAFDGVGEPEDYLKAAERMKHPAVGFVDRGGVHNFPKIAQLAKTYAPKPVYGVELAVYEEPGQCLLNVNEKWADTPLREATYVVFDLETTGLFANVHEVVEFGAVRMDETGQGDSIDFFIKPKGEIPPRVQEITNISNEDLKGAEDFKAAYKRIKEFVGDAILVAHNAISFDMRMLHAECDRHGLPRLTNPVLDTLLVSRAVSDQTYHSLGRIARRYNVTYVEGEAHRADYDSRVLASAWTRMMADCAKLGAKTVGDLNGLMATDNAVSRLPTTDMNVYIRDQEGVKAMYELVSLANTKYLGNGPRLPRSELQRLREHLLVANSPVGGELWDMALNNSSAELAEAAKFYDFITVAPPPLHMHEISRGNLSERQAQQAAEAVVAAAEALGKPVVGTSEPYYVAKMDKQLRDVYIYTKALNGRPHRLRKVGDKDAVVYPEAHYYPTADLVKQFSFLGEERAKKVVSENALAVFGKIAPDIRPVATELCAPVIPGVEDSLRGVVEKRANELYGDHPPQIVRDRIDRELSSIIGNGFAVVYWISHLLVEQSLKDGYLVGSRGSVGSSLVAYLMDITEVNPLPPHYLCAKCRTFVLSDEADSGFDLPPRVCECGSLMRSDGQDIPFETFLGFKGDKTPDIDLNFSGDYQARAHQFIVDMFGPDHAFRAGTVSTVADRTAFGYVRSYFEARGNTSAKNAEIARLAQGVTEVKRTTGQHPGGIIVVPKDRSVFEFTPYNFPADDKTAQWNTTHFQFEYIHDCLLKFDILGHDDPTALRMLGDLTGVDPKSVPFNDPKVMSLFRSTTELGVTPEQLNGETTGAMGIPEFGTSFVRGMLRDTKPTSFADLVRISGLSHGTDVWAGNARELVRKEKLRLKDLICCRDDIMVHLIKSGVDPLVSFRIMEDVRKGRGVAPDFKKAMVARKIPDWYIESCNRIKYMFPKAHAAAYVMMAWRIAWYKVYHPLAYYAVYFTIRPTAFNVETVVAGREAVLAAIATISNEMKVNPSAVKDKELGNLATYELCMEAFARGVKIAPIDINRSDGRRFLIHDGAITPPFASIDGLGEQVADSILEARAQRPFSSVQDFSERTKASKTIVNRMILMKVFANLPETEKTASLFD